MSSRGGMKSSTRTVPLMVFQVVWRMSESPRYCLLTSPRLGTGPSAAVGQIRHCPLWSSPSSEAKQASESNRGRQSQSTDPERPTRAAVCMSPISA
jgi:hypothetical protein